MIKTRNFFLNNKVKDRRCKNESNISFFTEQLKFLYSVSYFHSFPNLSTEQFHISLHLFTLPIFSLPPILPTTGMGKHFLTQNYVLCSTVTSEQIFKISMQFSQMICYFLRKDFKYPKLCTAFDVVSF